jgi:hypothetical protein
LFNSTSRVFSNPTDSACPSIESGIATPAPNCTTSTGSRPSPFLSAAPTLSSILERKQSKTTNTTDYASSHAVANISPAIFDLPYDVHLRFASLVKTYGLQVVDRASSDILPSYHPPLKPETESNKPKDNEAEGVGSPKGKAKAKKPAKEPKFGRVEPRWMLWSAGHPCM